MASKQPDDGYYKRVLDESVVDSRTAGKEPTIDNLDKEAERLARLVAENSGSQTVIKTCNRLLEQARESLASTTPDLKEVVIKLDKVKQRLLQAYESRKACPKWLSILLSTNFIYMCAIGLVIGWFALIPGQKNLENTAFVCLACALWGGLGGVVDAFVAIIYHYADQDFDLHYKAWYFIHPLQGAALGAVIYLLIQAGLLAVSGTTLQEATANVTANITGAPQAAPTGKIGVTALPIALAFLAGFKQSTAVDFINRIIKTIFQKPEA